MPGANLGSIYLNRGELHVAIQFYEQALIIIRELGDRRGEGTLLWNMSLALDQLAERAQAIKYAEQSLLIFDELEAPYTAIIRTQLAAWREQTDT